MQIKEGETPGFLSLFCIPCLNSGISINLRNSNSKNHNIEEKHLNSSSLFFYRRERKKNRDSNVPQKFLFCTNVPQNLNMKSSDDRDRNKERENKYSRFYMLLKILRNAETSGLSL